MNPPAPFHHDPVMVSEISEIAGALAPGVFADLTLGGAGHSIAVLEANPEVSLFGVDQDETALVAARERLAPFAGRTEFAKTRFDGTPDALLEAGHATISGFLMDLGVSSPQLRCRSRLQLPQRWPARHAHGHRPRSNRR